MEKMNKTQTKIYESIEKEFDQIRERRYKELKPMVKQKALSLRVDCSNTQNSFSVNGKPREYQESKSFNEFQNFLNSLEDDFKIAFYFWIEDGKFTWWDEQ